MKEEFREPRITLAANEYRKMTRRKLLQMSPLLAAGALLFTSVQKSVLKEGLVLSDWASGKAFSRSRMARIYSDAEVVAFEKFPYNYYSVKDPGIDLASWSLSVEGLVAKPGNYPLAQIQAMPKISQNTKHVCIEGWDAIGNFGGCRISDFLAAVGADPQARFLEVECADDYYESIDMESALHPQSLLCYEMYGKPLDRGHGAPLRLQMPTKLGYKQAKYLTTLRVSNVLSKEKGFWEDQGYSWFGGL